MTNAFVGAALHQPSGELVTMMFEGGLPPNERFPGLEANGMAGATPLLILSNFGNLAGLQALHRVYGDEVQTEMRDLSGTLICGACGFNSTTAGHKRGGCDRCRHYAKDAAAGLIGGYCAVFHAIQGAKMSRFRADQEGEADGKGGSDSAVTQQVDQGTYCDVLRCLADDFGMDILHCFRNGINTSSLINALETTMEPVRHLCSHTNW
jgi:hypothetical protein